MYREPFQPFAHTQQVVATNTGSWKDLEAFSIGARKIQISRIQNPGFAPAGSIVRHVAKRYCLSHVSHYALRGELKCFFLTDMELGQEHDQSILGDATTTVVSSVSGLLVCFKATFFAHE